MLEVILTDGIVVKIIGWIMVFLVSIIIGLIVYFWTDNKTTQKDTNVALGGKIDEVTKSLNMFIEETVSLKEDISEIKTDVAIVKNEIHSIKSRVDKHGMEIDKLNEKK